MIRLIFSAVIACVLFSCSSPTTLYTFSGKKYSYNKSSYNYLTKNDQESLDNLLHSYENIIKNQKGILMKVPPGIYADYGFALMTNGDVEEGKKYLEKEVSLYPESKIFINRILNLLN